MKNHLSLRFLIPASLFLFLSSCALVGIRKHVSTPKKAGRYPAFSESVKLQGTSNTRYRNSFDATFYELNVNVDDEKKYLTGSVTMKALAISEVDTIQIDLYPELKLNEITFQGKKLSYKRKYGAVFIGLPHTLQSGDTFSLNLSYEGSPQVARKPPWRGGFVWKKDKEKNPWIGVACESEGASLWWPCKDVNNDEPDSARVNLTVRKGLTGVSNGHLSGHEEHSNTATFHWSISYPINLYDISIYVGKLKLLSDTCRMPSGKILPINHYVLDYNYEKAKRHLPQAKKQIAFYEKTFGEYPWYKDGYKLIESPYEGMEHQTAIAYGQGYKNSYGGDFDYIILHESAHEWWGNAITASDFADVWLQEGFATYSEALYVENTQGKNAYYRYMLFYRLFIKNKWPVIGPVDRRYFDYRNSDCYQKGAWVLHTLRYTIGNDTIFFDILRTFFDRYKLKTTSTRDFISVVNEKTGTDLTWFFRQYLYRRDVPCLEYQWYGDDFYYRWTGTNPDFILPVDILLDDLIRKSLSPELIVGKISISRTTYSRLSFNDFLMLYGVRENKKLRKIFSAQKP